MRAPNAGPAELRSELQRIETLPVGEVRILWKQRLRQSPPATLAGNLLLRAYAHALQEQAFGPLPLALRNRLNAVLNDKQAALKDKGAKGAGLKGAGLKADHAVTGAIGNVNKGGIVPVQSSHGGQFRPKVRANRILPAGTRLIREWQGIHHEVIVLPDGFLWQGQIHASLSVIAQKMTGTKWNGWIFFGLKRRAPKSEIACPVSRLEVETSGIDPEQHVPIDTSNQIASREKQDGESPDIDSDLDIRNDLDIRTRLAPSPLPKASAIKSRLIPPGPSGLQSDKKQVREKTAKSSARIGHNDVD